MQSSTTCEFLAFFRLAVSEYEVRYGTDFESMRNNLTGQRLVQPEMITSGNITTPKAPGETEDPTIVLDGEGRLWCSDFNSCSVTYP